ncbi:DUF6248 family natural product biosynthesis protein [Actinomadura litoris]|uniref:DUF6248 family natural product biosynthesis protein n=1 Tax=Actinomadura litoris TaxID=2678616 RepID=UPI001FA7A519|nr:DUF6248 family natural product biosynthesis protein [Actinomadura litoris]
MITPEAAAWIRAHVWTGAMRKTHTEVPGVYTTCACQGGLTSWCQNGRCDRCHRATPLRDYATVICLRGGSRPAMLSEPFTHRTDVSATGPRFEQIAMVWLADRVCRWACPCTCHTASAAPVQLDLLEAS